MDSQRITQPSQSRLVEPKEHSLFTDRQLESVGERGVSGGVAILRGYLAVARAVDVVFDRNRS